MASMDAIQKGVARFIDAEILPKLPVDGAKRFGVGLAASVMTKRGARILEGYKDNEWMNKLGVIDAGGNVDLEIGRPLWNGYRTKVSKSMCHSLGK